MQKQHYFRVALRLFACLIAVGVLAWAAPASAQVTWGAGQNIGNGAGGAHVIDGDLITITAGGSDIWDASDGGYFLHRQLAGDGTIVAKVESMVVSDGVSTINGWAKAGVMFRETLDANSKNVYMMQSASQNIRAMQFRDTTGGSTANAEVAGMPPAWVKLVRKGNVFYAYHSTDDGITWTLAGTHTTEMNSDVFLGLCVTSHDTAIPVDVMFSNVSITEGSPAEILVKPLICSFGQLAVNSGISSQRVEVVNVGSQPLTLNSAIVAGAGFALVDVKVDGVTTALPVTVNRLGAKVEAEVTFDATAAGSFNGTLTLGSDDPENPTVVVPLVAAVGSGVTPPVGWLGAQNVGNANGNHVIDGGQVTISVGSGDVWGTTVNFYYLYRQLKGDGVITAKVESIVATDGVSAPAAWAKVGVMFRESLDGPSIFSSMIQTYSNGRGMQGRDTTGGSAWGDSMTTGLTAPGWVKLMRNGDVLTGYHSEDGATWTTFGSHTTPMPRPLMSACPFVPTVPFRLMWCTRM